MVDLVRLKEKNVVIIGSEGEGIPGPVLQIVNQGLYSTLRFVYLHYKYIIYSLFVIVQ